MGFPRLCGSSIGDFGQPLAGGRIDHRERATALRREPLATDQHPLVTDHPFCVWQFCPNVLNEGFEQARCSTWGLELRKDIQDPVSGSEESAWGAPKLPIPAE